MIRTGGPTVYRGCTPVVDSWFEVGVEGELTRALADAVAEAKGLDTVDLPPLYRAVELDALERVLEQQDADTARYCLFSFVVGDSVVFVRGDGRIRVCDTTRPTDPEPVFETLLQ